MAAEVTRLLAVTAEVSSIVRGEGETESLKLGFENVAGMAGASPQSEVYRGNAAGCTRPSGAVSFSSSTWLVNTVQTPGATQQVHAPKAVPADLVVAGGVEEGTLQRLFDNYNGDPTEALGDLKTLFGRYYSSLVSDYGGEAAVEALPDDSKLVIFWQIVRACIPPEPGEIDRSIGAMSLACFGSPTVDQLALVIQRFLHVARGCVDKCPIAAHNEEAKKAQRLADQINSALAMINAGNEEEDDNKLRQGVSELQRLQVKVILYATVSGKESSDVYLKTEIDEAAITRLVTSLGPIIISNPMIRDASSAPTQVAGRVVVEDGRATDDETPKITLKDQKFVLVGDLPTELRRITSSIVNKHGTVDVDAADPRAVRTAGMSVGAITSEVAEHACRLYNKDRSRYAGLTAMINIITLHGSAIRLHTWGKLRYLENTGMGSKTTFEPLRTAGGKITQELGRKFSHCEVESMDELAMCLTNAADALSFAYDDADALHVQSLTVVANMLRSMDREVAGRLSVSVVGPDVQEDFRAWLTKTKNGTVEDFTLSEDTMAKLKRQFERRLGEIEDKPELALYKRGRVGEDDNDDDDDDDVEDASSKAKKQRTKKKKTKEAAHQSAGSAKETGVEPCAVCGKPGHKIFQCPERRSRGCFRCGESHCMRDCTVKPGSRVKSRSKRGNKASGVSRAGEGVVSDDDG
jgi:hypothetical protein